MAILLSLIKSSIIIKIKAQFLIKNITEFFNQNFNSYHAKIMLNTYNLKRLKKKLASNTRSIEKNEETFIFDHHPSYFFL